MLQRAIATEKTKLAKPVKTDDGEVTGSLIVGDGEPDVESGA